MNELAKKLQAPFREEEYEWRVQQETKAGDKVLVLCYVQARAIMDRLDEAVGPLDWEDSYQKGPDGGVACHLSIRDREAVSGDGYIQWISKEDVAENTDIEPVKGGVSGALKRAAVKWGIGRLLYKLQATWVPLQNKGQHYHKCANGQHKGKYFYWDNPVLPGWAVAPSEETVETPQAEAPPEPQAKPDVNIKRLREKAAEWLPQFASATQALSKLSETQHITNEADAFINEWFAAREQK